jgi:hypothetical protein
MTACEFADTSDVELYFYDELADPARARVEGHLRGCAACRHRLDDLHAIRRALAGERVVDAPPAGDWSGFMQRLDAAVGLAAPASDAPAPFSRAAVLERRGRSWSVRQLAVLAATLALVAIGVLMAARARPEHPPVLAQHAPGNAADPVTQAATGLSPSAALREVSAEHLERSKLVVLGLAARDPQNTRATDWRYERQLAGSLLPETRLYRIAAQERGVADVAHVMRDLETVLLEASMSDGSDRDSLERVQRLIARRGLVSKMQIVATTGSGL